MRRNGITMMNTVHRDVGVKSSEYYLCRPDVHRFSFVGDDIQDGRPVVLTEEYSGLPAGLILWAKDVGSQFTNLVGYQLERVRTKVPLRVLEVA